MTLPTIDCTATSCIKSFTANKKEKKRYLATNLSIYLVVKKKLAPTATYVIGYGNPIDPALELHPPQ